VVGKFSDRVRQLVEGVERDFVTKTAGSVLARKRGERLNSLKEHVLTVANRLLKQQVMIVETSVVDRFKKSLLNILATSPPASSAEGGDSDRPIAQGQGEREGQALRKAIFDFKTQITDLEIDDLFGSSASSVEKERIADLTELLEGTLKEFPETPVAKLEELKRVEAEAKSESAGAGAGRGRRRGRRGSKAGGVGAGGKKWPRVTNIALNLVGMFRPPGFGNLQGFVGYATSLLGLPLDLLLGVQNDGDSPEVIPYLFPYLFPLFYILFLCL
jgi:hypothetical protein